MRTYQSILNFNYNYFLHTVAKTFRPINMRSAFVQIIQYQFGHSTQFAHGNDKNIMWRNRLTQLCREDNLFNPVAAWISNKISLHLVGVDCYYTRLALYHHRRPYAVCSSYNINTRLSLRRTSLKKIHAKAFQP